MKPTAEGYCPRCGLDLVAPAAHALAKAPPAQENVGDLRRCSFEGCDKLVRPDQSKHGLCVGHTRQWYRNPGHKLYPLRPRAA